jgi:hypothetical protein
VWWFGTTVEDQLEQVKSSGGKGGDKMLPGKRMNRLRELLGLPKMYRDPAGRGRATTGGKGGVKL